jgi:acylphosphatase
MMPAIRITTVVRGRVQGVGFRFTTKGVARRFAVSGFVQNEADGSVLCVAEGEASEIEGFLQAVAEAMACNIAAMESTRSLATGEFDGFAIRR